MNGMFQEGLNLPDDPLGLQLADRGRRQQDIFKRRNQAFGEQNGQLVSFGQVQPLMTPGQSAMLQAIYEAGGMRSAPGLPGSTNLGPVEQDAMPMQDTSPASMIALGKMTRAMSPGAQQRNGVGAYYQSHDDWMKSRGL